MANIPPVDDIDEQNQIERIKLNPKMTIENKKSMMVEVRKSFTQKKQPSIKTILSVTNLVVGSSILVLPLSFYSSGYGTCIIAVILMSAFYACTGRLVAIHLKSEEKDFIQSIERVLGSKWKTLYSIASQAILWLGAIIYFLMVSNILYSILGQLIGQSKLPSKDTITYGQFSFQWTGFIFFIVCFILFSLKDVKIVLKVSSKGIYCVLVYFIFITYLAIKSIAENKVHFEFSGTPNTNTLYFTTCGFTSFLQALGVFALSYCIHNLVSPILKVNKNPKKNPRDVAIACGLGGSLLIYAGFVGLLGVFWREITIGDKTINLGQGANTIMDLFDNSDKFTLVFLVISEILLVFQLLSIVVIIGFLARTQLFNMIYGPNGIPPLKMIYIFSGVCCTVLYLFQIFNYKPIQLIEYSGTIAGFVICYLLPVGVHLKSVYKMNKKKTAPSDLLNSTEIITHNFREREEKEAFLSSVSAATVFLEDEEQSKIPAYVKYIGYAGVLAYGAFLIVLQLVPIECST